MRRRLPPASAAMISRLGVQYVGLVVLGILTAGALGYCTGHRDGQDAQKLAQQTAAVAVAREGRAVAATGAVQAVRAVDRGRPAVDQARALVGVVDATTLTIRVTPSAPPERLTVPPQVVARMVQDSLHILRLQAAVAALTGLVRADSALIASQDALIKTLRDVKTPRCQAKCGAAITVGAIIAGVVVVKKADDIWRAVAR